MSSALVLGAVVGVGHRDRCLLGGVLLVVGATEATRPLLRQVLAAPVVSAH